MWRELTTWFFTPLPLYPFTPLPLYPFTPLPLYPFTPLPLYPLRDKYEQSERVLRLGAYGLGAQPPRAIFGKAGAES
jgi:hypothetical protein